MPGPLTFSTARQVLVLVSGALALAGCATSLPPAGEGSAAYSPHVVRVVAAENFWGSIVAQIGGTHAHVVSVIDNPSTDPHAYEPTAADARVLADAQVAVENGAGYDPTVVEQFLGRVTADLSRADPSDGPYFTARRDRYEQVGLATYHAAIARIRDRFAGTPVGASESIVAYLCPALGLDLVTPPSFLRAVSEGTDVSAGDTATINRQIRTRAIAVYLVNTQNLTPDVQAQVSAARAAGIPRVAVTETLVPSGASFQAWQTAQLDALDAALERSHG